MRNTTIAKQISFLRWFLRWANKMGYYTGRRTFIVNCLRLGVPAEVIMKWTGHSDYKAMKPYIKIVDKLKVSEMEKFNTFTVQEKEGNEPKK